MTEKDVIINRAIQLMKDINIALFLLTSDGPMVEREHEGQLNELSKIVERQYGNVFEKQFGKGYKNEQA